jgi:hypothetical protein
MPWAMAGFALNLVSGLIFLLIFPGQYPIGAVSLVSWFFVLYFGSMLPFLGAAY